MSHIASRVLICALTAGLGMLTVPGIAAAQEAAPTTQPYSALVPGPNLLTLPGLTPAQLGMAQSINDVCPNINGVSAQTMNSAQLFLAKVCNNMTGTAVVLQGGSNPAGLPVIPGLTIDGVKNALTQIDGGAETVVPTSQTSVLRNLQGGVVSSRLSVLHARMLGGMASGDTPTPSLLAYNDGNTAADAHNNVLLAQTAPTEMSMWHDRLGLFVNAIGQFGNSSSTGNQNGYDFDSEGFVVGADYSLTPKLTLGIAFGYTHSNTDFTVTPQSAPGQFLDGDLFEGSLYATWYATDALYFDGVASFGGGNNDSQRHVVIPGFTDQIATGSFGTRTYGVAIGGGYGFPMGALTLTPTVRFEYHHVEADGFTENGASGLDLTYGTSSQDSVLSFIGGQAQYAISTSFGVITPTARAEWAHQYNSGNTTISIAYANDPLFSTFTLAGQQPSRNYFDLGVGAALQLAGNWSGFVNYDAILGVSQTSFNSFTAGVRLAF